MRWRVNVSCGATDVGAEELAQLVGDDLRPRETIFGLPVGASGEITVEVEADDAREAMALGLERAAEMARREGDFRGG